MIISGITSKVPGDHKRCQLVSQVEVTTEQTLTNNNSTTGRSLTNNIASADQRTPPNLLSSLKWARVTIEPCKLSVTRVVLPVLPVSVVNSC